jgi:hypothetical protein
MIFIKFTLLTLTHVHVARQPTTTYVLDLGTKQDLWLWLWSTTIIPLMSYNVYIMSGRQLQAAVGWYV